MEATDIKGLQDQILSTVFSNKNFIITIPKLKDLLAQNNESINKTIIDKICAIVQGKEVSCNEKYNALRLLRELMYQKNSKFVNALIQHKLWGCLKFIAHSQSNTSSLANIFNQTSDDQLILMYKLVLYCFAEWNKLYGVDKKKKNTLFNECYTSLIKENIEFPQVFPTLNESNTLADADTSYSIGKFKSKQNNEKSYFSHHVISNTNTNKENKNEYNTILLKPPLIENSSIQNRPPRTSSFAQEFVDADKSTQSRSNSLNKSKGFAGLFEEKDKENSICSKISCGIPKGKLSNNRMPSPKIEKRSCHPQIFIQENTPEVINLRLQAMKYIEDQKKSRLLEEQLNNLKKDISAKEETISVLSQENFQLSEFKKKHDCLEQNLIELKQNKQDEMLALQREIELLKQENKSLEKFNKEIKEESIFIKSENQKILEQQEFLEKDLKRMNENKENSLKNLTQGYQHREKEHIELIESLKRELTLLRNEKLVWLENEEKLKKEVKSTLESKEAAIKRITHELNNKINSIQKDSDAKIKNLASEQIQSAKIAAEKQEQDYQCIKKKMEDDLKKHLLESNVNLEKITALEKKNILLESELKSIKDQYNSLEKTHTNVVDEIKNSIRETYQLQEEKKNSCINEILSEDPNLMKLKFEKKSSTKDLIITGENFHGDEAQAFKLNDQIPTIETKKPKQRTPARIFDSSPKELEKNKSNPNSLHNPKIPVKVSNFFTQEGNSKISENNNKINFEFENSFKASSGANDHVALMPTSENCVETYKISYTTSYNKTKLENEKVEKSIFDYKTIEKKDSDLFGFSPFPSLNYNSCKDYSAYQQNIPTSDQYKNDLILQEKFEPTVPSLQAVNHVAPTTIHNAHKNSVNFEVCLNKNYESFADQTKTDKESISFQEKSNNEEIAIPKKLTDDKLNENETEKYSSNLHLSQLVREFNLFCQQIREHDTILNKVQSEIEGIHQVPQTGADGPLSAPKTNHHSFAPIVKPDSEFNQNNNKNAPLNEIYHLKSDFESLKCNFPLEIVHQYNSDNGFNHSDSLHKPSNKTEFPAKGLTGEFTIQNLDNFSPEKELNDKLEHFETPIAINSDEDEYEADNDIRDLLVPLSAEKYNTKKTILFNSKLFMDLNFKTKEEAFRFKKSNLKEKFKLYADDCIEIIGISGIFSNFSKQKNYLNISFFVNNLTKDTVTNFTNNYLGNESVSLLVKPEIIETQINPNKTIKQGTILEFFQIPYCNVIMNGAYNIYHNSRHEFSFCLPMLITKFMQFNASYQKIEFNQKWALMIREGCIEMKSEAFAINMKLIKDAFDLKKYFHLIELNQEDEYLHLENKANLWLGGSFELEIPGAEFLIQFEVRSLNKKQKREIVLYTVCKPVYSQQAEYIIQNLIYLFQE